jgi:2-enoate reductase
MISMYEKLFQPGNIGAMHIKNRIIMAPMGNVADLDGGFSQRQIDYYVARAKGGAGLIMTGSVFFTSRFGAPASGVLEKGIHVARLAELADGVHRYGAKLAIQFNLGGGRCGGNISASEVPTVADPNKLTRALTIEEIHFLIEQAGASAKLAKQGGADAIILHAYAGYLLDQFQSAEWNHRTDQYGGSLENRMRLTCELIQSIKQANTKNFPVLVKFSVDHGTDTGRKLDEGLKMCKILEAAGCDGMLVDTGSFQTKWNRCIPTVYEPEGYSLEMTKQVKQTVSFAVIGQNKLFDPAKAEKAISDHVCDFVALGHAFIADPEWPNKVHSGQEENICPCIGCNDCLLSVNQNRYYRCAVNPYAAHERQENLKLKPSAPKKKILVIGGGPAGMTAAQYAAKAGNDVELWDRGDRLGGNMLAAGAPSFKHDIMRYVAYMERKTRTANVKIHLNREAAIPDILAGNFDYVILAAGAHAKKIQLESDGSAEIALSLDVLRGKVEPGRRVVVVGGGLVGCELACSVAERADEVTILEFMPDLLMTGEEARNNALALRGLIASRNIRSVCNAAAKRVEQAGITYVDRKTGVEGHIPCDTVIMAIGFSSNDELAGELKKAGIAFAVVGDAQAPRKIGNAVREGLYSVLDME